MRWPNYTPCQTFDKGNQDHKVVYSLKTLHLNKEQFYACVFPGFYKYVSHSFDQSNFARCYWMSELCCKFSGGETMRFWFRPRRPLTVAVAQKMWPSAKNLVRFVLFVDEAGFEVFTQFKMRKMKLPCSVLQNHISILSTIPFSLQQCNIKESHWHQLDFDQWMIAEQRMPRSRLGFHKFTTKKP